MTGEAKAIRAVVLGRVQGVGFRDYVESHAHSLRLRGFVQNLGDGSVEVVAEGDDATLKQLIEHLRVGPRMARVDAVDVVWVEATGHFDGFGTAW
jgi:acylphosphatase